MQPTKQQQATKHVEVYDNKLVFAGKAVEKQPKEKSVLLLSFPASCFLIVHAWLHAQGVCGMPLPLRPSALSDARQQQHERAGWCDRQQHPVVAQCEHLSLIRSLFYNSSGSSFTKNAKFADCMVAGGDFFESRSIPRGGSS